ncbi:MAG: copper resistance protein CopC [Candidatus Nanopelagicales bacterium]
MPARTTPERPITAAAWACALGAVVALVALLLGFTAVPAQAHSDLVSSSPTEGQALDAAPAVVELTFNEEISDAGLQVVAQGPQGTVTLGTPQLAGPKLTVPWPQTAPAGSYTLAYRVVSADGHPIDGSLPFSYGGAASPASNSAATSASAAPGTSASPSFVDQGQAAADASATATASKESSRSAFWPIVAVVAVGAVIGAGIAYALRARAARRS